MKQYTKLEVEVLSLHEQDIVTSSSDFMDDVMEKDVIWDSSVFSEN